MPKCKNNPLRFYKGTEPSPKGKGFCASGAKVGMRKRGTDGHMWSVKKIGKSQRWIKCSTIKSMQPKKKKTFVKKPSTNDTIRVVIQFKPFDPYQELALSPPKLVAFLKSQWIIRNFNDILSMGIAIENKQGRHCYDKTIRFTRQGISAHVKKGTISMVVYGKLVEFLNKGKDTLLPIHDKSSLAKSLKETLNHSIYAGGLISMRYTKYDTNDIGIVSISYS